MAFMDSLHAAVGHLVKAEVVGQRGLAVMVAPINGAITEVTRMADELGLLPLVEDEVAEVLQRGMGALNKAQARVGEVISTYTGAMRILAGIDERWGVLQEQIGRAAGVVGRLAPGLLPGLDRVVASVDLLSGEEVPVAALTAYPHLMVLQPLDPRQAGFYFGLATAAFNELKRKTGWQWSEQERLGRRPAQQAVGPSAEKLTLRGVIYPHFKGGIGQLNQLRAIGARQAPFMLTTGYGEVLGTWCLSDIEESQGALLPGGIPRKQEFTLELVRYGDDMQDL